MKGNEKKERKAREKRRELDKMRAQNNPLRAWAKKTHRKTRDDINRHPAGAKMIVSILETLAEGPHGQGAMEDLYREELQTDAERRYFERCRKDVREAAERPLTGDVGLSVLPGETVAVLATERIREWVDMEGMQGWAESKAKLERSMGRDAPAEVDYILVKSFFEWLAQTKDNAQQHEMQTQEEAVRIAKERRSRGKGLSCCLSGAIGGVLPQLHIAGFFPKLCELVGATTWRQKQELKSWILNRDKNPLAMIPEPRGEGLLVKFVDIEALGYIKDSTHPAIQAKAARVQNLKRGKDEQQEASAWDGFFHMVVNLDPILPHRDELRPPDYRQGTMQQDLMQPHRMLKRIEDYLASMSGVSLVLKGYLHRPDVKSANKSADILWRAHEALKATEVTVLHDVALELVRIIGPYIDQLHEQETLPPFYFRVPVQRFFHHISDVIKKKRLSKEVTVYMLGALLKALYSDTDRAGHYYSSGKGSKEGALFWIEAGAGRDEGGEDLTHIGVYAYTKKTRRTP